MQGDMGHIVRQLSAEQLEEHDSQCVDIAAGVDVVRIRLALFGTHVLHGSDQLPGDCL